MNQRIEQALATLKEIEAEMATHGSYHWNASHVPHVVSIYCAQLEKEVMSDERGERTQPKPNASVGAASTENTRPIAEWQQARNPSTTFFNVWVCGVLVHWYSFQKEAELQCAAINAAYQKRREEEK
jgi:hypothetical protein